MWRGSDGWRERAVAGKRGEREGNKEGNKIIYSKVGRGKGKTEEWLGKKRREAKRIGGKKGRMARKRD